jgi:hypothetical protein
MWALGAAEVVCLEGHGWALGASPGTGSGASHTHDMGENGPDDACRRVRRTPFAPGTSSPGVIRGGTVDTSGTEAYGGQWATTHDLVGDHL